MKPLLLLLLVPMVLPAQAFVSLDISGDWRLALDDRPAYAAADFDDRSWKTITLPRGEEFFHGVDYWLRRQIELPASLDRQQLTLSLGAIIGVYEVYLNGQRIGSTGAFASLAEARIPRPLTFDIPPEVLAAGPAQVIALRVRAQLFFHPDWRLRDVGPYLIANRAHAPVGAGRQQLESRWVRSAPHLICGVMFAFIGIVSLLGWLGERDRRELLWFMLVCFARFGGSFYLVTALLADGNPYSRAGVAWEFAFGHLDLPLFAEFVFAALGAGGSRALRAAMWAGWCLAPLSLLASDNHAVWQIGFPAYIWVSVVAMMVVLANWWRLATRTAATREQHALRLVLFTVSVSGVAVWITFLSQNIAMARGNFQILRPVEVPSIAIGPHLVQYDDLFWLVVSTTILALLFRRTAADRRERQWLAGELEAARTVQQLLLPQASVVSSVFDVAAVYEPAQQVGGDFHWNRIEPDGSLVVVVGDVSGKGLKAAMLVSVAIGILRNEKSSSPGAILAALNEGLAGHTGGGFVTCCCARFDVDGRVTIANAGHPAPYADGRELEVESGLPLGVVGGVFYAESVSRGQRFTFFSDGVVEAENAQRELFGFDRTREISTKSAQEIAQAAKAWGQNDDITVVTVRRPA